MKNKYLALTQATRDEMLTSIGLSSIDDLFNVVPKSAKMATLNLEDEKSEFEVQRIIKEIAKENKTSYISFMGGGAYNRYVPSAIGAVASRYEFLSAYTPYQAEISQGTLEVMYDFQSLVCKLTNQDVSNASVYDGATACAEAILMASRLAKGEYKNRAFVSKNVNPNYLEVIKTYLWANNMELVIGDDKEFDGNFCCRLYQTPNYYGEIEKTPEKIKNEFIIASVNPMALALIEPPNVDITVGDIQPLGIPVAFGGPYGGFISCKDEYKRQLAGRIVGKSIDKDGNPAYVLTLQAREQHIRREKATSNICSNQALMALTSTLYMDLVGEKTFVELSEKSAENAYELAQGLIEKGYKILNEEFFNEFTLLVKNSDEFLSNMKKAGILAGIKIDNEKILVATTELTTKEDIELYLQNA